MQRNRPYAVWAMAVVALHCTTTLIGCRPAAHPRPNVILIVVDTLRADHLGAYGYGRPTSPTFDALAARGLLFTQAHSVTSWTNPAIASLFTGTHPQVLQPGASVFIATNTRTLAQAFHEHGYRTAAFVGNAVLSPELGFAQGFDTYIGVAGWVRGFAPQPKEPAERVSAAALGWLGQQSHTTPWFLYLHYMDPHWPYEPPHDTAQRFWRTPDVALDAAQVAINARVGGRTDGVSATEAQQITDVYDAAIAHFDAELGHLVSALETGGLLANTVLCIVADHGEELGDHGGVQHARSLYEEVLHIPLLLIPAAERPPERLGDLVQISAVGRTLLDLAGLADVPFPAHSLLRPSEPGDSSAAFAELMPGFLTGAVHQYALLQGTTKLIVTPAGEDLLFDLERDPLERGPNSSKNPELLQGLKETLARRAVPHTPAPSQPLDAATRERLRALGYQFPE